MNTNEFIKNKLHEMFVELGEKIAKESDDFDFTVSIPMQMFRAEEHMRTAWDNFLVKEISND